MTELSLDAGAARRFGRRRDLERERFVGAAGVSAAGAAGYRVVEPVARPEARSWDHAAPAQSTFAINLQDGRQANVGLTAEPLIRLDTGQRVAKYLKVEVQDADAGRPAPGLSADDQAQVDRLAYGRGLPLLTEDELRFAVLPTSARTLVRSAGRFAMLSEAMMGDASLERRLICELTDVDPATPAPEMTELVRHVGVHRRTVFARLPLEVALARWVSRTGVVGVSFDLRHLPLHSAAGWTKLDRILLASKAACSIVLLHHLSPEYAARACQAGATHAVLSRLRPIRA